MHSARAVRGGPESGQHLFQTVQPLVYLFHARGEAQADAVVGAKGGAGNQSDTGAIPVRADGCTSGKEIPPQSFDAIYRVIDEEVPAERVVDLTSLSGDPEVFKDHVHPTPRGAGRIAGLVAERLAPDLP